MTVRAPGLPRLQRDLQAMGRDLEDLADVNRAAAQVALSRARPPRRTGVLDRSLGVEADRTGWGIASSVDYAGYVHDGTRYTEGHPFATAAIEDTQPSWIQLYEHHIDKAVDQVAGNTY